MRTLIQMLSPIRLPAFVVALGGLACKLAVIVGMVGLVATNAMPFAVVAAVGLGGILALVACVSRLAMAGFVLTIGSLATSIVWLPAVCLLIYVAGVIGGLTAPSAASATSAR